MDEAVAARDRGTGEAGRSGRRVLFLATDLSTGGGVNRVIRDLATIFRRRLDADVTVINARSDAPPSDHFPKDVPVQSHRRQSLLSYFRLLMRLRRTKPDIVISSWTQDNILATLAFLFSRTKVVAVEHSSWHFHRLPIRLLRRIVYPLSSAVVVLNRRDLAHYRRYLPRVRLIPDPVGADPATSAAKREKLIIAIGHLLPLKNFEDAISAMARSGLERRGWSLAIIGSGQCEARLRRRIEEEGLERTQIHPPTTDLASWYARASIILVTSRLESFSLVLAEAMLAGVVPLAYASDGPAFILEDFPDHLVAMDDVGTLARRLSDFAERNDLDPLRRKLQASIQARFSPEIVAEEWRGLL